MFTTIDTLYSPPLIGLLAAPDFDTGFAAAQEAALRFYVEHGAPFDYDWTVLRARLLADGTTHDPANPVGFYIDARSQSFTLFAPTAPAQ